MLPFHKILATTALCLAAMGLSSCCFEQPLTCNLRELVTPPDARVAMVDHHFPHRPAVSLDGLVRYETGSKACSFEPYLYQLNGIYYQRRTIQYAKAHRPIIRRADRADHFLRYPLTHQQLEEQFTFDSSIPEEVWMQPVGVTGRQMNTTNSVVFLLTSLILPKPAKWRKNHYPRAFLFAIYPL